VEKEKIQNCKNPDEWPFARIAAAAAAARPDLVIHVGDYEYRAALCPAGEEKKCGGSPEPYSWEAWKADFFEPAKPLLEAAPWIMVRGNHELCRRAGEGWFRFLDTSAFDGSCRDLPDTYIARLGAFGVIVVDGAQAAQYGGDLGKLAEGVRGYLAEWQANLPDEVWIATHPPIGRELAKAPAAGQTKPVPGNLSMVVSGHFHSFHTATFGGASTPQTVIGLGGAMLDTPEEIAENREALGASDSSPSADFGYMVWDKTDEGWSGTLFDSHGKPTKSRCELKEHLLHCELSDNGGKI
jgi:predicted phosphodiesterase